MEVACGRCGGERSFCKIGLRARCDKDGRGVAYRCVVYVLVFFYVGERRRFEGRTFSLRAELNVPFRFIYPLYDLICIFSELSVPFRFIYLLYVLIYPNNPGNDILV